MSIPEHSGLMNNGLAGSGRNSHESKFRFDEIRLAIYRTSLFLKFKWFRIVSIWNVHSGHSGLMNNDLAGSGRNSHESKFRFDVIRLATYQTSLFLNANDLELFQFRMSIPEHSGLMDNGLAASGRNSHESKFRFDVIRLATYQTSLFLKFKWFRIVSIWNVPPGTFRVDGEWTSRFRKKLSWIEIPF